MNSLIKGFASLGAIAQSSTNNTIVDSAHVILVFIRGDSNADGRGDIAYLPLSLQGPLSDCMFWDTTTSDYKVLHADGSTSDWYSNTMFGLEISLLKNLRDHYKKRVYCVKHGVGGTRMATDWLPSQTNAGYKAAKDKFVLAYNKLISLGKTVQVFSVTNLGGNDCYDMAYVNAYLQNETDFITNDMTITGLSNAKNVMYKAFLAFDNIWGNTGAANIVNNAKVSRAASMGNTAVIEVEGYERFTGQPYHCNYNGYVQMGVDAFNAIKNFGVYT